MPAWLLKPNWTNALWLGLYLATMAGLVFWLAEARGWVLAEMGTPAARAQWQDWKAEVAAGGAETQTVARRVPSSEDPPALVLFRDSFPGILVTCLAIGTFVFVFLMVVVRGAFGSRFASGAVVEPRDRLVPSGSR